MYFKILLSGIEVYDQYTSMYYVITYMGRGSEKGNTKSKQKSEGGVKKA